MTVKEDDRLLGRHPEFARMSLRPGIGAGAMPQVLQTLIDHDLDRDLPQGDVPLALRHGAKKFPLGRYLRRKLRQMNGMEANAPQEVIAQQEAEMRDLYTRSLADPSFVSIKEVLIAADAGKVASLEARQRIFKKRKPL